MANRPIPDILAERKRVAARIAELNQRLAVLDSELYESLQSFTATLGQWISQPVTPNQQVLPTVPPPIHESKVSVLRRPSISAETGTPERLLPTDYLSSMVTSFYSGNIGETIEHHTVEFLNRRKRPLKTREIMQMLSEIGVEVPGKEPMNNLSAHLSRSARLARVGDGWWFAEKQEPPGGGS